MNKPDTRNAADGVEQFDWNVFCECMNCSSVHVKGQYPSTLEAETTELRAENERQRAALAAAKVALEFYADESRWYTPKFCNDYLHNHPGHRCDTNKWAFNYKGDGDDKAREALASIDEVLGETK